MTAFLTGILFIHARLMAETGGEHGLPNLGLLQLAAARPQATVETTSHILSNFRKNHLFPPLRAFAVSSS